MTASSTHRLGTVPAWSKFLATIRPGPLAAQRRQELGNELSDGFSTLYEGRRWDVAVYRVFGEAAGDFVKIRLGPQRAESGDHVVG
jgi:hypothetical protein